jgi:3-hydroxybutyryl-CoA dehydratase
MGRMGEFYVSVGDATSFSKTVGEYDVFAFAGISGDFAPNHVNRAYMQKSGYKDLIAHGALLVGYMSTASTQMATHSRADPRAVTGVSLGYDRMRFLAPVYFGDTITVDYRIVAIDPEKLRATADIRITKQDGTLVAVAQHLLKWVRNA